MNFLNKLISYIKGEKFILDDLPTTYLFYFFLLKIRDLFYGFVIFRSKNLCFVHPSSRIRAKSKFTFGKNLTIDRNCYLDALSREGIVFGKNVSVGKFTMIECTGSLKNIGKGLIVGDNVGLGTRGNYGCAGGVKIGSNTIIGSYVSFHSENHNFDNKKIIIRDQGVSHKGIEVGENCWIGAKATFLDGSVIGSGCVVAAGCVVRGVYGDNLIIGGVPSRILRER